MSWNIIFVLIFVGIGAVFGMFRGFKNSSLRLLTVVLSLAASIAIAVALQSATGFELMVTIKSLIKEEAMVGVLNSLKGVVPFGETISPILSTIFFGKYCSVLLVAIIFLIVNKLGRLLYAFLSGIGHKTDKLRIQSGKKKITFTGGLLSSITGALVGVLQGLLIAGLIFAPICEIAIALA